MLKRGYGILNETIMGGSLKNEYLDFRNDSQIAIDNKFGLWKYDFDNNL